LFALLLLGILAGCDMDKDAATRGWDFAAQGVTKVIVRSCTAKSTIVRRHEYAPIIKVKARTALIPSAYHTSGSIDGLTPSKRWPFDFQIEREGAILRFVSKGEMRFPQHRYVLRNLEISVPSDVEVVLETAEPEQP
jgi:hypothetical protein